MSKSILVIDTPDFCMECPMCFQSDKISIGMFEYKQLYSCRCAPFDANDGYLPDILHHKPDWCPLLEMPKKMVEETRWSDKEYAVGYNSCIDEILKQDKKAKEGKKIDESKS